MRNTLTITIRTRRITAREIRPADYLSMLNQLLNTGEERLGDIAQADWDRVMYSPHLGLIDGDLSGLSDADMQTVIAGFRRVNAAVFRDETDPAKKLAASGGTKPLINEKRDLMTQCAQLMRLGYPGVWEFGWEFYLCVQNLLAE